MKANELVELTEYRKTDVYGTARTMWEKANAYYEQTDVIPVPNALNAEGIHLNTARRIVDTGDHNYTKDNPVTEVRPSGRTKAAEDRARDTQTVLNACLKEMLMPVVKQAPKKLLLRGVAMLGLWFNDYYYAIDKGGLSKDELDELADRALWEFPLTFKSYDPLNCYPSRAMQNAFQPRDMIIHYDVTTAEAVALIEQHPAWKWKPKVDEKTVKFYDYYTNTRRIVVLGDKKVYDGENALGFVPFVIITGGFGQSSWKGDVAEEWRPIFYGEQELLSSEQIEYSARRAILLRNAWPQKEVIGDAEAIKAQFPEGIPTNPDEPVVHSQDVVMKEVEGKNGPDYGWAQGQAITSGYIGAPNELSGERTSGVYSGRHAENLITHQRVRYKDALMNFERGLEFYLRMCSKALKVLDNEVSVYAFDSNKAVVKSIQPDRLDDRCFIKVKLVSEAPDAQMAKRQEGISEWRSDAIDYRTMCTEFFDYDLDQAEIMYGRKLLEKIEQNPTVMLVRALAWALARQDKEMANAILMQFQTERGGANNISDQPMTGAERVPQMGERSEGAPPPSMMQ